MSVEAWVEFGAAERMEQRRTCPWVEPRALLGHALPGRVGTLLVAVDEGVEGVDGDGGLLAVDGEGLYYY